MLPRGGGEVVGSGGSDGVKEKKKTKKKFVDIMIEKKKNLKFTWLLLWCLSNGFFSFLFLIHSSQVKLSSVTFFLSDPLPSFPFHPSYHFLSLLSRTNKEKKNFFFYVLTFELDRSRKKVADFTFSGFQYFNLQTYNNNNKLIICCCCCCCCRN